MAWPGNICLALLPSPPVSRVGEERQVCGGACSLLGLCTHFGVEVEEVLKQAGIAA